MFASVPDQSLTDVFLGGLMILAFLFLFAVVAYVLEARSQK